MSELQAITGQLFIANGVLRDVTPSAAIPGLLVQPGLARANRSRERDLLFVHLTLTGAVDETAVLCQHLLTLISQKFYSTGGSATAALRGAVLEANQQLLRHNLGGNKGPSREGAITCATFHQGELFTLQVGESFALLGRTFGIERMPPKPPLQITPLGRSSGLDIRYYHHRVQAGDLLLLADPRLSHLPTEDFNPALVENHVEAGMGELVGMVGDDSARLLLVEFSLDAPLELPDVQPQKFATNTAVSDPQPRRSSTAVAATAAVVRQSQPQRAQPVRQQPGTSANQTSGGTAVDREVVERQARRAGSKAALGASRFTAWLADLLARLRSPEPDRPGEEPVNWTWAALIAITIPILMAAIVTSVYMARGQAQDLTAVKAQMSQELVLAEEAPSEAEARQHYVAALALADQANVQLRPGDAEVSRMQLLAREQLDELDDVTRLTAVPLYQYSEGTNLKGVTLREGLNGGIYTLDVGNGLTYEHETDESYLNLTTPEPTLLLANGQAVGSHVVEAIVDFFWRPQGFSVQREGLAMLDKAGALLTFQPSLDATFAVPLDLSVEWVNPVAAADFDERLYVLDTGAEKIWKYYPDGDNFIAKADDRFIVFSDDPDLGQAVDFDIYSEDGSLVILYGDGRVRYYDTRNGRIEWDETTLLTNGLNVPLLNPTSAEIVGRGLNATVFIADSGNGRVVQISRPTGVVLAQFRATAEDGSELLTGMSDFAIAEQPLRLFVTKGSTLYSATLE